MIGAVVKENIVENIIVLNETQIEEMETALGCEIVDARPYGLTIGDLRTIQGWTRNAGGEQILLPLQDEESYESYVLAEERTAAAEETAAAAIKAAETASEATADEALGILNGEVEA